MAVLTSWSYARTRVRQAKTGQRVRLSAVVTAQPASSVFNLTHPFANYGRTSERMANPYFAWGPYATPPLEHDSMVAGAAGCTEPRFCWSPSRSIILTCNDGGSIVSRRSDDDAYSFNAAGSSLFSSASHPDISSSREGLILYSAYVSGALHVRRQYPGDASPAVAFSAEDDGGSPLVLEDDSFRIVAAANGWHWLHWLPDGETETALWYSTDDGESWTETSGAVTGIANGEHPGMCALPSGDLYAFAYVAGSGYLTRRFPGDVDWSTPIEMEDDAGDPLEFTDAPFSITGGYEGPNRLVLAANLDGDMLPCELASSDDGTSWKLLSP
jgi:hypothetical protein